MRLYVLPFEAGTPSGNMALDAALLEQISPTSAVFRAYSWSEPAVTFGFSQKYEEIRAVFRDETTLCRRPTGGGIVDHRNDWTYCLVLGINLPAAQRPAPGFYCFLHETIGDCLKGLGANVGLAPCEDTSKRNPVGPSQCFNAPVASDLIRPDGRKVAGAALRRTRKGLLVQGSFDRAALPVGFDFKALQARLPDTLSMALGLAPTATEVTARLTPPESLREAQVRFASEAWNRRR